MTVRHIIDMSRAEHARLRALHGAEFPDRIAPWLELLWIIAAARQPVPSGQVRIDQVVLGLLGDIQAAGKLDGEAASWILAALEEHCEQERLSTTLLYEAQSNPRGTEDTEGAREEAGL